MYNVSITSRDSNHLPSNSNCDDLPTTLRIWCSKQRGKMIYEGYGDHRGRTGHALVFFIPAKCSTSPEVF